MNKSTKNASSEKASKPINKPIRLHSYKEFTSSLGKDKIYLAGFKMYLKIHYPGKQYMKIAEWREIYNEYQDRQI